jgi:protein SCO1/2
MNETPLFRLIPLLLALLVAGCSRDPATPPLQGARLGGAFTLTDQDGRQVTEKKFDGKYRLIYFGFTYCPDVCPVDLQSIGKALRQLEKNDPTVAERIQPIFITVDPERDTPEVMKQYVSAFHPRLTGLTGTPQQIKDVVRRFGAWGEKEDKPGATDYGVNHSRIAILFGRKGEPIAILPHEQGAEAIAAELKRWVI